MLRHYQAFLVLSVLLLAPGLCGQGSDDRSPSGWRDVNGRVPPVLIQKIEAEYTPQALAAKIQGTVRLHAIINESGQATQITVVTPLGLGLDESAVEAFRHWKFQPAMQDGKPVAVEATVDVAFSLDRVGKAEPEPTPENRHEAPNAVRTLDYPLPNMAATGSRGMTAPRRPYTEAIRWTRMAAESGYAPAARNLGLAYERGEGAPRDYNAAVTWYQFAAVRNDPFAQNLLGMMYAKGRGVRQSYTEAYVWFRIAARSGEAQAGMNIENIAPKMTPEAVEQAEQRAKDWKPEPAREPTGPAPSSLLP